MRAIEKKKAIHKPFNVDVAALGTTCVSFYKRWVEAKAGICTVSIRDFVLKSWRTTARLEIRGCLITM